jgi:hypothetical protein
MDIKYDHLFTSYFNVIKNNYFGDDHIANLYKKSLLDTSKFIQSFTHSLICSLISVMELVISLTHLQKSATALCAI